MAQIGDNAAAKNLIAELDREAADDTIMQRNTLPTIRALIELSRSNPAKALDILSKTSPYDMGTGPYIALLPVYVRGLAYLQAGKGPEAVTEFQKIVQYRGLWEPQ